MRRDLAGRLSACRFFLRRPSEAPRPPPLSGSSAAVPFGGPQNSPKILTVKVIVPQRTGSFPSIQRVGYPPGGFGVGIIQMILYCP